MNRHPWLCAACVVLLSLALGVAPQDALPGVAQAPVPGALGPAPNMAQAPVPGALLGPLLGPLSGPLYPSASDRFGFGVNPTYGAPGDFDVARLRAGWYVDWGVRPDPPHPAGLEHMQIVHTSGDTYSPGAAALSAVARANPGQVWMVGNEPDCIWQGNSTPEQYARVYHEVYHLLKAADPTCRVTIGGIVQATPLRLQWLDAVLDRYSALYGRPFPADLWNIHAHILREERGSWGCEIPPGIDASRGMLWEIDDHDRRDLFAGQIVRFRQWMRDRGQRDKELIVSEYGILMPDSYGFDAERVRAFMLYTFDYLMTAVDAEIGCPADGNRLVQRWAWYSLNDRRFEGHTSWSHLFDPTSKQITALGLAYEGYVTPLYTPYVDLVPAALQCDAPALAQCDAPALGCVALDPAAQCDARATRVALGCVALDPAAQCDAPALGCVALGFTAPITFTLTALIRNRGNRDAAGVSVRFWGDGAHPVGAIQTIPSLPARALAAVSVDWPGLAVGPHTVEVIVDAEGAIPESDEGNNRLLRAFLVAGHRAYLPLAFHRH